ncbi:Protein kinase-like domain [Pseudocohnilembus persalinus]|uniref:non-specific serine/threonine protein kinase n=1 Tax=Pseudocohnilembus persalinus TaxID=266149 RepID=A0A0V0QK13_PSEPJ|nr:Protein kinase-like domain [Pseudocohnilembus persalinus]|eukprot:KRX02442.1 Protein kinase-like domain [Pseudocohnilembus persalinus]
MNLGQQGQRKIGNYQIGEIIGNGATGSVYKGLNCETGETVAIKQNFKIQRYVEGGSLANIIKKFDPFSEQLVAIFIKQVLLGLEYLHKQGIVHRDIKGANILTTKNGIIKLTDFGVATTLSDDNKSFTNHYKGTPYWMAPEAIEMQGQLSTSCDIWSVGCTVIELLTGNPPYHDLLQYPALLRMVEDEHPPLPEGVSEDCVDFLLQCFERDPAQRIDASQLLKHPWIYVKDKEVTEIINSPDTQGLPEEVTKTIARHLTHKQEDQDNQEKYNRSPIIRKSFNSKVHNLSQEKQWENSAVFQSSAFNNGLGSLFANERDSFIQDSTFEKRPYDEGSFVSVDLQENNNSNMVNNNIDSLKSLNFFKKGNGFSKLFQFQSGKAALCNNMSSQLNYQYVDLFKIWTITLQCFIEQVPFILFYAKTLQM